MNHYVPWIQTLVLYLMNFKYHLFTDPENGYKMRPAAAKRAAMFFYDDGSERFGDMEHYANAHRAIKDNIRDVGTYESGLNYD